MTPEQQRIAIAEACGWSHIFITPRGPHGTCAKPTWQEDTPLPDYLNDLNAMHEAEKRLTDEQIFPWWNSLLQIVGRDCKRPANCYSKDLRPVMATAAQRAEAFLKTLNLWTE